MTDSISYEVDMKDEIQTAPIGIIPLNGTEAIVNKIEYYLSNMYKTFESKIIKIDLLRFSTGDAKAVLEETVRGMDIYIIVDVGNYNCSYEMYGHKAYMSPDEHFQNLKRTISAIGGKAYRITVVMPMLYSARQDRRIDRESLDCAVALRELENMGVKNIMSFDVHDVRVQNAVPFTGFDNLMPTYQVIKALTRHVPDFPTNGDDLLVISPDVGATARNLMYANELGVDMGLFYKKRQGRMVNGKYPVAVHKYIGPDVEGKTILVCDDLIASGETLLDVARQIKQLGGGKIYLFATFGLFTEGIEKFKKAYKEGLFTALLTTNATYRCEELLQQEWYMEVDISKYVAYYIYCVNSGKSISSIINPHKKIGDLLEKRHKMELVY